MQSERDHLPRQRDLRRHGKHMGLRSRRSGDQKQHQARLVEKIRTGKSLQYGRGLRHSDEPAHVEGVRSHRRVLRSPDGLQKLQDAPQSGQPRRGLHSLPQTRH